MSIEQAIRDKIFRFWVIIALVIVLAVVPASALSFTVLTAGIPQGASVFTGEPGLNFTPAQAFFVHQAGLQPAKLSTGLLLHAVTTSPAIPFPSGTGGPDLSAGTACSGNRQSGGTALHISPQEEDGNIRAVQEYILEKNLSWTAGKTSVSNLTPAAYTALRGLKHSAPGITFPVRAMSTTTAIPKVALPASFDWRNNGGDWTTPIRNQGYCGSCWAFASTATFESFWERIQNNPNLNPDFAEQYLVSCDSEDSGCDGGGSPSLGYFVNNAGTSGGVGTVVESDYPYTASDSSCKSLAGKTRYKVPTSGSWSYLAGDCVISPVAVTKQAIYTYGPLNAYMYATDNFSYYTSGIFEDPGIDVLPCQTNHVVQLVGWGHDPVKNKDYWIAKNSWGTNWGENGWFKVYTDQVRVGEGVAYLVPPAKPTITVISPTSGPTAGGTRVTVTGTGFTGATAVKFGPNAGTGLTVNSSTKITITSPARAAGVINVTVTTPGGTSALVAGDKFTYYIARPTVTVISPTSGPTAGGTRVTVTGTGFTGATAVKFGPGAGTGLTVNSSTKITITSPAHAAGVVNVTVTSLGGTSALVAGDKFTYGVPP